MYARHTFRSSLIAYQEVQHHLTIPHSQCRVGGWLAQAHMWFFGVLRLGHFNEDMMVTVFSFPEEWTYSSKVPVAWDMKGCTLLAFVAFLREPNH